MNRKKNKLAAEIDLEILRELREKTVNRWRKTGLLEGLKANSNNKNKRWNG